MKKMSIDSTRNVDLAGLIVPDQLAGALIPEAIDQADDRGGIEADAVLQGLTHLGIEEVRNRGLGL